MTLEELTNAERRRLFTSVCSLADTKLLLGYHYFKRVIPSPSMENSNALQGQAANEFGQAHEFLKVAAELEDRHGNLFERTDPNTYYNMSVLDESPGSWPEFLAVVGLADLATQIRLNSFEDSNWSALGAPAVKAIQEEEFHAQNLIGAIKSYVLQDEDNRDAFDAAFQSTAPDVLRWFGPTDEAMSGLKQKGVVTIAPDVEQELLIDRLDRLNNEHFDGLLPTDTLSAVDDFEVEGWDETRLRPAGGPDKSVAEGLAVKSMERAVGIDG